MKKTFKNPLRSGSLMICLALCSIIFSACEDNTPCKRCDASFARQRKVKQIVHTDASLAVKERFRFYYQSNLIDSIVKVSYPSAVARGGDSTVTSLKVYYGGNCLPSSYEAKTYATGAPVSVEKAFFTYTASGIINKHLAFYPDENFLVVDETADIDYTNNASGQVLTRNGTDYGILIYPEPYGNKNSYTYTGSNITKVVTWKEQAGYNLTNVFDKRNNPFNIQGGILYYLSLTSYPDEEFYETICRDQNNPTSMVFKGTDTSNSFVTITSTFTYTYDVLSYPTKVGIVQATVDEVHGNSQLNLGSYQFSYY
jgi:hypothetical protein